MVNLEVAPRDDRMPTPRFTITYQPTLDDQVNANLTSTMDHVHPWRATAIRLVFYLGGGGVLVYLNHKQGNVELTRFFAIMVAAISVSAVVSAVRMRKRMALRLRVMFEKKKNIGLAVPATVTLYDGYLESASTLERTQVAWDVVEEVVRRDGFVLITYGLAIIYLPERIFEGESACAAFVAEAQSLHAAAYAQPGDLTATRWGRA